MDVIDKFAKAIKGAAREADPFSCRYLRAKTYVPDSFAQRDASRSPSRARYWCSKTMRPEGPDGASVLPEACTDERACFEAAQTRSDG